VQLLCGRKVRGCIRSNDLHGMFVRAVSIEYRCGLMHKLPAWILLSRGFHDIKLMLELRIRHLLVGLFLHQLLSR
jgi:hypothetical protein